MSAIRLRHFLLISIQLGLLLVLLRQFQIESGAFLRLAALAFGGFAIYAWLPLRFRLLFFVLLSLAGIMVVMGLANGAWLVGISLLLIGICHIKISFVFRGILLVFVVAILAAQRATLLPFPWSEAIWPILGSMFMFRLIVYFYDLRHDKVPGTATQALAYFFMLPNACFPLFPVVDYKEFRRCYFDDDAYPVYQVGIDWMVRGVIHLILYRVIYYYFTMAPSEVANPAALINYLVSNFLLYLRVSGLFHLIVGMLYLFGFRLPETHNRYLLAASFTDFWRRINIYWKDFMQKIFYYPAVFKLRKLGATKALVIATLYVFVMTWFLHAYQWFWLRGSVLFVAQDILFWAILGILVVLNSLYEIKHGRARTITAKQRTTKDFVISILKTYATFWFICVLWSFWTAETIGEWMSLWGALGGELSWAILTWPAIILGVVIIGSIPKDTLRNVRISAQQDQEWTRARVFTVISMVALIIISIEGIATRIDPSVATVVHSLRSGKLSRLDQAKLEKGYYENLLSVDRFNSQLWEVYTKKPANWLDVDNANLKRFVGGFVQMELIPSFISDTKYGVISINRWGMRDADYTMKPAPETFRAVVLGASSVMGWGVGDGETFEALVEERLNREQPAATFAKYEFLNFGVPGYQPPQQLMAFEKAMTFQPHAVIYVATGRELSRSAAYIAEVVKKRIEIPFAELQGLVQKAGITADMEEADMIKKLMPYYKELLSFVYGSIARRTRAIGATPVWVFLPQVTDGIWREETPDVVEIAETSGFVLINLDDIYQGRDISTLRLAEWDDHPNPAGHRLVAARLYDELVVRRDQVFKAVKMDSTQ
ncbi:MAG: hypothetical protein H6975_04940 [Gammaproteobacteria bacterium]|nr:hypothetical protein [Gammaproteobacteria bacterium]